MWEAHEIQMNPQLVADFQECTPKTHLSQVLSTKLGKPQGPSFPELYTLDEGSVFSNNMFTCQWRLSGGSACEFEEQITVYDQGKDQYLFSPSFKHL